jgi:hypothetical protein
MMMMMMMMMMINRYQKDSDKKANRIQEPNIDRVLKVDVNKSQK